MDILFNYVSIHKLSGFNLYWLPKKGNILVLFSEADLFNLFIYFGSEGTACTGNLTASMFMSATITNTS